MTVADLLPSLPLSCDAGRMYGLVFAAGLAERLAEVQLANPSQHYARPVLLADGRYLLCGDLLSEVGPRGLYSQGFAALSPRRFDQIDVLPWEECVAMLPPRESPF